MLAGLLLLAYAPMVNVVIGEWKAISQPMNDAEILTVTKVIERYGLMAQIIAVFCIAGFIYKMRDAGKCDHSTILITKCDHIDTKCVTHRR